MPLTYTHILQTTHAAPQASPRKMVGIVLVALLHVAMFYAFTHGMKVSAIILPQPDPVLINIQSPPKPPLVLPKFDHHDALDKTLTEQMIKTIEPVIDILPPIDNTPVTDALPVEAVPAQVSIGSIGVLHRVDPVYPASARRAGEQGTVVLSVMVDASGLVSAATVLRSSGSTRLDDAALTAIKRWQFAPRSGGTAQVRVPFSFKLEMTRG